MKNIFLFPALFALLFSCASEEQKIINRSIESHGGNEHYENIEVGFDFRGIHYQLQRKNGSFSYERIQKDSLNNEIKDILTNEGHTRFINEQKSSVPDSMAVKYSNSVNSVAYFFLLPFGLNDEAVNKIYDQEVQIKGETYKQISISFQEEGGGKDHEDKFMIWINKESNLMDYLAYSYLTDGGGVRFREAINRETYGNFEFQDYHNYGYEDANFPLVDLISDFEKGDLPLLSKIENENISLVEIK